MSLMHSNLASLRWILVSLAAALLLAGCAAPAADPGRTTSTSDGPQDSGNVSGPGLGLLVPPAEGQNETDGLRLEGREDRAAIAPGETVWFNYTATNIGADAVTWGACYVPQAFVLRDESGKEHPLQVPMATCLGFSEDPFPAGAKKSFGTTWNGTYAEGDQMVQAPEGAYEFVATFTAWRGDDKAVVELHLPIGVLPPNALA